MNDLKRFGLLLTNTGVFFIIRKERKKKALLNLGFVYLGTRKALFFRDMFIVVVVVVVVVVGTPHVRCHTADRERQRETDERGAP